MIGGSFRLKVGQLSTLHSTLRCIFNFSIFCTSDIRLTHKPLDRSAAAAVGSHAGSRKILIWHQQCREHADSKQWLSTAIEGNALFNRLHSILLDHAGVLSTL